MQEMKYFNEGNDCDICKNQLMTGREQCEENGQDCRKCSDLMIKEQEAAGHERYNTDS